jgi:hypothetical protein
MKVTTAYGEVDVSTLIHHYEVYKKAEEKKYEKRLEFLLTDEGKEWNRKKSKSYYERNKQTILAKRKELYEPKRVKKTPVEGVESA